MDEYKLKDYTERLKKETNENAHKMLYMWIKQDVISLNEYQQLVLNLSLQNVSKWKHVDDIVLSEWSEIVKNNSMVKLDNGTEARYCDDWGDANATHASVC